MQRNASQLLMDEREAARGTEMRNCWGYGAALLVAVLLFGCSRGPRGGPRLTTSPVTGIVSIDGKPTEMVEVTCRPLSGTSLIKYDITAVTNAEGKFTLGTYEGSDGLPAGTYVLTFKWLEPGLTLKDKFKGKYANPAKSEHEVTVESTPEETTDLGTIELSTKK